MNYYYQLELLAGLFVMSCFLIAAAMWCLVLGQKQRNDIAAKSYMAKYWKHYHKDDFE
jgi:hypothetical protein